MIDDQWATSTSAGQVWGDGVARCDGRSLSGTAAPPSRGRPPDEVIPGGDGACVAQVVGTPSPGGGVLGRVPGRACRRHCQTQASLMRASVSLPGVFARCSLREPDCRIAVKMRIWGRALRCGLGVPIGCLWGATAALARTRRRRRLDFPSTVLVTVFTHLTSQASSRRPCASVDIYLSCTESPREGPVVIKCGLSGAWAVLHTLQRGPGFVRQRSSKNAQHGVFAGGSLATVLVQLHGAGPSARSTPDGPQEPLARIERRGQHDWCLGAGRFPPHHALSGNPSLESAYFSSITTLLDGVGHRDPWSGSTFAFLPAGSCQSLPSPSLW